MANIELDGGNKKIKVDSGDLTLDVPGDIILDADGANVTFKDGGTSILDISNSSSDAVITSSVQDKDLIFKGDDGGSAITALTLDMSAAGAATFNGAVTAGGILKTDDTTEATSTTDGSLQTDGGLSVVKDAVFGDDIKLLSDSSVIHFGADSEVTLTHVADAGLSLSSAGNLDTLSLISTDADANIGPNLVLYRNSASPADDDLLGELTFRGRNDNSQDVDYFIIDSYIKDASDGTEDNVFSIKNMQAGTSRSYIKGSASELIINEDSVDLDFRVESNADTHAIYVNAGNDITSFYSDYGTSDPISNTGDDYGVYTDNNGKTVVNTNGDAFGVNRQNSDGAVINIFQEGQGEGNISVSGTTVSYNTFCGAHWSRLTDNSKPTILRGTVIESIGTMMDWYNLDVKDENNNTIAKKSIKLPDGKSVGDSHTVTENGNDYTGIISKEDNEQLPKCKISDTEDSKAVYGVFMAWDDQDDGLDSDVNDMHIASLGAFVVRIHKDETIAIGDYLQSKGDGTAKKQADDILRASTIAKVTSTTKTITHSDGSYCVPCVLHCG